jgi:NADPH:quinone reductase-like Zn-dependent oxidoreductase
MSRAVIYETHGGPEVLEVRQVLEPHAGPGEFRVRVRAAGLNAMDGLFVANPAMASAFGIVPPAGFGYDFAGVVDEVGDGATGFAVGDRVYGGAMAKAVADFVIVSTPTGTVWRTPEGLSDEIASTLPVAGMTAAAVVSAIGVGAGDTVLVGGAAGGVGVLTVQLARLAGAAVIGTASEATFDFLRKLGAEPVAYGDGLADRVRAMAPRGVSAAADLFGTEAAQSAIALGVAPDRIATIAAGPNPPPGVRAIRGGADATPADLEQVARRIVAGEVTVPIAARLPVEQIRDAVTLQNDRHVHGKIVIIL